MQLETSSCNLDAISTKISASTEETITLVKQHAQEFKKIYIGCVPKKWSKFNKKIIIN